MKPSQTPNASPLDPGAGRDGLHKAVIDAIPDPIFVVDGDVRILDSNSAAADMMGGAPQLAYGRRGGDVLHCVHAHETPDGCGAAPACRECMIRNSVSLALGGQRPRRVRHKLETISGDGTAGVDLLVTTAPIHYGGRDLALLILEDISELVALRRIVPICAHCHRVRDDAEYWQNVESYCRRNLDIQFSHGICPDCLHRYYPEMGS